MNYYEQIQKAIDYIELNIQNKIVLQHVSNTSHMSLASFYRLFYSLTGYTVKDYIRLRRINLACTQLKNQKLTILDIAFMYDFKSNEAFSRAFKRVVGCNPSEYKQGYIRFEFNGINILDTYFKKQENKLTEKYPDIKVLQQMDPMKVAVCRVFSDQPEPIAINRLIRMAKDNDWLGYRIFGYDVSDSNHAIYGYEACITIDNHTNIECDGVSNQTLAGGLYAVTCVKVKDIKAAWSRFVEWLEISPYILGSHQWLEEHIEGINDSFDYKVQLLMPIERK